MLASLFLISGLIFSCDNSGNRISGELKANAYHKFVTKLLKGVYAISLKLEKNALVATRLKEFDLEGNDETLRNGVQLNSKLIIWDNFFDQQIKEQKYSDPQNYNDTISIEKNGVYLFVLKSFDSVEFSLNIKELLDPPKRTYRNLYQIDTILNGKGDEQRKITLNKRPSFV